jgi:hypothetical protein
MTGYAHAPASTTQEDRTMESEPREPHEDEPGEPGAEGGTGGDADTVPAAPSESDDTAAGDTDQHSSADA